MPARAARDVGRTVADASGQRPRPHPALSSLDKAAILQGAQGARATVTAAGASKAAAVRASHQL